MLKKPTFPVLLAILAALWLNSTVLAQEAQPLHGGRRGVGVILSIGDEKFSIESRQGEPRDILVDGRTLYRTSDGQVAAFGDLQVGQWVAGLVRYNAQGQMVARRVLILPKDFDPSQRLGKRARGSVTGVDIEGSSFNLHTLRGEDLTLHVSEGTIYVGRVQSLQDLEEGMQAAIGAIQQEDSSLLALVVLARKPLIKHAGTITAVDASGETFTLDTRLGETQEITVDEYTRFRSKDGAIQGLEEVQPGMLAVVVAKVSENSELVARLVLVGRQILP